MEPLEPQNPKTPLEVKLVCKIIKFSYFQFDILACEIFDDA